MGQSDVLAVHDVERELILWRQNEKARDKLIYSAYQAGVKKYRIHRLTGISRSTIDRVLAHAVNRCDHDN